MVMPLRLIFAAGAMALATTGLFTTAAALAAPPYTARKVGAWTVAPSKDGLGCFVTRQFPHDGDTTLLMGMNVDGTNHLSLLNANWSIKPKEKQELTFRLTTGGYASQFAVGIESAGKRGFVTSFDAKFPVHFASSKALHVFRGKVPVEKLELAGSGAAVAELRKCLWVQKVNSPTGAQAKDRPSDVPRDPFAEGAGRKPRK